MQTKIPQAINFQIEKQRNVILESLSVEYLNLLAILYGTQIESGQRRISDYGSMTMLEVENEIRLRTMMLKGQRMHKKKELREQHTANELAMLEELKRAGQ